MNTVKFDNKDSYADFGLLLQPMERPKPSPKINMVSIEGRSGDLDLTEALGDVQYDNLDIELSFTLMNADNWDDTLSKITNYLHGRKRKIIFSDDADYYYEGRITVDGLSSDAVMKTLTVKCNCNPYKLKNTETVVTKEITGVTSFTLSNSRKSVMPEVLMTGNVVFKYDGKQFTPTADTPYRSPQFMLKEGDNTIEIVSGTGSLKFTYREGSL